MIKRRAKLDILDQKGSLVMRKNLSGVIMS